MSGLRPTLHTHTITHTHTHAPFRTMARADEDSVSCQASHLPDCPDLKVGGRVGLQSGADIMTNSLLPLTGRAHTILLSQLGVLALLDSRESCQKKIEKKKKSLVFICIPTVLLFSDSLIG